MTSKYISTKKRPIMHVVDTVLAEAAGREWVDSELAKAKEAYEVAEERARKAYPGPSAREVALAREVSRLTCTDRVNQETATQPAKPRVYLASSISNSAACRRLAGDLRHLGVTITSSWHGVSDFNQGPESALDEQERLKICNQNFDDLRAANDLVFLPKAESRGSLVEVGFALGNKTGHVFAIGDPMAHTLMVANVTWCANETELVKKILDIEHVTQQRSG